MSSCQLCYGKLSLVPFSDRTQSTSIHGLSKIEFSDWMQSNNELSVSLSATPIKLIQMNQTQTDWIWLNSEIKLNRTKSSSHGGWTNWPLVIYNLKGKALLAYFLQNVEMLILLHVKVAPLVINLLLCILMLTNPSKAIFPYLVFHQSRILCA